MFRVLKNPSHVEVDFPWGKRRFVVLARKSLTITDHDADTIADHLLSTYSFLQDITKRILEDSKRKEDLNERDQLGRDAITHSTVQPRAEAKRRRKSNR